MSINIKYTDDDWARLEHSWSAWWAGEIDRPMVNLVDPLQFSNISAEEFTREFLLEKPVDEVLDYYQAILENSTYYGDSCLIPFFSFSKEIVIDFTGTQKHPFDLRLLRNTMIVQYYFELPFRQFSGT